MALTSKDHEEIRSTPFKEPPLTGVALSVLRLVSRIPWIKKRLNDSIGGLNGRIFRHRDNGEFREAVNIGFYALEKYRNKNEGRLGFMKHHNWWSFMRHTVENIEKSGESEHVEKAIAYGQEGIEPFEGYDVAYSFTAYSRWRYRSQSIEEAVELAKIASKADQTWGYPEFLLGWYGLVSGLGNPVEHLREAVKRDPRIIFRVTSDPICRTRPDIANKLKALAVAEGIIASPNNAPQPTQ